MEMFMVLTGIMIAQWNLMQEKLAESASQVGKRPRASAAAKAASVLR
jgi:hypothetical protein